MYISKWCKVVADHDYERPILFLKQVSDNLRSFRYTKVIGFDTQIIIFYIAPVCFCKMFAVNRTFVVHFFYFCGSCFRRNVVTR